MTEGALATKYKNIYFNRDKLIKDVKESWKIEVWDIKDDYIETFDEHWSRIVNFRFLDKINLEEIFQFNGLDINKERFFKILWKLDPSLFMVVNRIAIINSEKEFKNLMDELHGYCFTDYPGTSRLGEHWFNESCVVIFMEAIRNVVKEEMEIWPYTNELQELNRAFWQTIVHELRHTMQDNPLFENKYEAMSREERERDAENYCREIFENIVVCYDYCVIS